MFVKLINIDIEFGRHKIMLNVKRKKLLKLIQSKNPKVTIFILMMSNYLGEKSALPAGL